MMRAKPYKSCSNALFSFLQLREEGCQNSMLMELCLVVAALSCNQQIATGKLLPRTLSLQSVSATSADLLLAPQELIGSETQDTSPAPQLEMRSSTECSTPVSRRFSIGQRSRS